MADSLPFDILQFKIRRNIIDGRFKKVVFKTKTRIDVKPSSISGQNGPTIRLRVVDSFNSNNIYRVVINEETFQTCYINIEEYSKYNYDKMLGANPYQFIYQYESWGDYLKRTYYITKPEIAIYDEPNGAVIFKNEGNPFLPFNVVDIDGDWIKLEKHFAYRQYFGNSVNYEGWTQWKEKEKILISITETAPII